MARSHVRPRFRFFTGKSSCATRIDDINDMVELRERLNIVRADLASLLVSVQNLHEKAEEMDKTLTDAENLVDNPDEVL